MEEKKRFSTRAIHSDSISHKWPGDPVVTGISLSTTFKQKAAGKPDKYEYSRSGNPTREALENTLAALEDAKYALTYSSGLAAEANILHLLQPGDEVICCDDVYGGTNRLFNRVYSSFGLIFKMVDMTDLHLLKKNITEKTKMIWGETPTNPTLKIVDIEEVSKLIKTLDQDIILVVDNTFMSPVFQKPLKLKADISITSVTKYINGHSDVVMGSIALNNDEMYKKLVFYQNAIGAIPSAFDCYLVIRGVKTLELRMHRHQSSALQIATYFSSHKKIKTVIYPGLESHPQHKICKKQTTGFSGIISMVIDGDAEDTQKFLQNLEIFSIAESLGGFESLVEVPSIMTHSSVPPNEREILGISDSLVRFSIGLEDPEDLIEDIKQALSKI